MHACRNCGATHEAAELGRHEVGGRLTVHCPNCHAAFGRYDRGTPRVDALRPPR